MRLALCLPLVLGLTLAACGDKEPDPNAPVAGGDPAVQAQIKAWMDGFDADLEAGNKAYGTKDWLLPGDDGDSVDRGRQVLTKAPCESLAQASNRPVATQSSGGQIAQVRALWLYAVGGCAGVDPAAQSKALGALEGARRRLLVQWETELNALPGSVRIEAKAGNRAKKVARAAALGVNEYSACIVSVSSRARHDSQEIIMQKAIGACDNNSDVMYRFGACEVDWVVANSHGLADSMQQPRDDDAWVGDATARYRMAWRACDDNAFDQWRAYLGQTPQTLKDGRLKRISAPNDPLLACQSRQFRRMAHKYGTRDKAYKDADVVAWCGRQTGLQDLAYRLEIPHTFTPDILNDSGRHVSWLYDPAKANQRPNEWKFTDCMRKVAQRMAQEGHNLPDPETLAKFCTFKNGKAAMDYVSGQSLVEGRSTSGPEPE